MAKINSAYTKKVIKHFKNPHNYGKMENYDGLGKVGNPTCGDVMWLYIKITKNKKGEEVIKDIKFETFGCVAAISTSSIVTDLAKGKTLKEAIKIDRNSIVNALGGLPPIKLHCSVLASDALLEAIYDFLVKNKRAVSQELENNHKRIEASRHTVEEKYQDWVQIEETIHKDEKNKKNKK